MRGGLITAGDLDDALDQIKRLGDRGNAALASALNAVAKHAVSDLQAEVRSVFDRPAPFTVNAFRVLYAKPSNPEAAIWVKDEKDGGAGKVPAVTWFEPQVYGGDRAIKRSEYRLREAGILPAGHFIRPGPGARLDGYGNMSRGHMQQIMSGLGVDNPTGSTIVATDSERSSNKGHAKAFFVIRRGKTPIGIAERRGDSMSVVLVFVRNVSYAARFDFDKVVRRVAENDALLEEAIARAAAEFGGP